MLERLQKILSARGIASRRKAEEYIQQGLVKVNGVVATIGQKADPEVDTIEVDGSVLQARQEMLYYLMHKPVGVETSNVDRSTVKEFEGSKVQKFERKKVLSNPRTLEPSHSPPTRTVRDLLPKDLQGKIYPVGRLDKDSSGLLLLTNDGVLAYRLMHPSFDHEKEYRVQTDRPIPEGAIRKLEEGITLDGVKTKPARIRKIRGDTLLISLTEGRNRQIRRMCSKVGYPVVALERVRIMTLTDDRLEPGQLRKLTEKERTELLRAAGVTGMGREGIKGRKRSKRGDA